MLSLATCLLHHQTSTGSHYDWLIDFPPSTQSQWAALAQPCGLTQPGLLWTARVAHPSHLWPICGSWPVQTIAEHRRVYLDYQGPLTQGRGQVTRIDGGIVEPRMICPCRLVLDLKMQYVRGTVDIGHQAHDHWLARWLG